MSLPTLDQSLPWTKKTNRTLENELSNIRSVVALNQENESNSWKWAFQHSISRCPEPINESNSWKWAFQHSISPCPEPRKRIELLKMSFPTLDQSLLWTKKTNRTLENEHSNTRSVVALNQENESNSWKWAFQHSISRCPEPINESNSWKWAFQHSMVQGNDWSNVGKLIFKISIRFLGSGQRLIECWKAHFQEFDSFSWFRATTDRMLESSFSRVRFVSLVQGNDWSSVGKLNFKSSIRLLQSLPWTKETNRTLENELSNIRSVVALNQVNESNSWNWAFQHSISRCPEPRKRIELLKIKCWKAHFQEFDSFSSVVALNQENESNSWKWAFQHSISRCPEPRKRIELLKMSFPTFD